MRDAKVGVISALAIFGIPIICALMTKAPKPEAIPAPVPNVRATITTRIEDLDTGRVMICKRIFERGTLVAEIGTCHPQDDVPLAPRRSGQSERDEL
jgi:hypothetical protein